MARDFTREEFHALVWSEPMTHLAKEFGLSDVALHKVCRKHGIPTPPPGWWAKKAAGKDVAVAPLPPSPGTGLGRITIAGGELRDEPSPLAIARESARVQVSSPVSEAAVDPHPVVERTLARLRRAKPSSENGLVSASGPGLMDIAVAPASIDRLEAALTAIGLALRAVGGDIVRGEKSAMLVCEDERIAFTIRESLKREPHVLTKKEEAEQKAWEARQARRSQNNSWVSDYSWPPRFPEWDHHPTGQLAFEMERRYVRGSSPRRSFRDGKTQTLETLADDIAVGVAVMAAAIREDRRRREEEERQLEEARQRRLLGLRAQHVAERRDEALQDILDEVAGLERLRQLIASLRESVTEGDDRVRKFLTLASQRLADSEAALSPEGLQQRFEEDRLFGEDDDHGFRPPYY